MAIYFATGNQGKLAEVRAVLNRPVQQIDIELPELQAIRVQEVIEAKARAAYAQLQQAVLVEDTGLYVHAWNDLPGALIRWFLATVGTAGICQMMSQFDDRCATAESCLGYFDGSAFCSFSGQVEGTIVSMPRGELGFGWDPIFQPKGLTKTFAELSPGEKNHASMRTVAAQKLKAHLDMIEGKVAKTQRRQET
jgi:non-canonical purine NTP pyrophosphatase (RdgB/HAM1 family)